MLWESETGASQHSPVGHALEITAWLYSYAVGKAAGTHTVARDLRTDGGADIGSGVYFIRMEHRAGVTVERPQMLNERWGVSTGKRGRFGGDDIGQSFAILYFDV
jgi:hypothetical protein